MLTAEAVDAVARDLFPARGPHASYEYVSAEIGKGWAARPGDPQLLLLTVRLITWTTLPNGDMSIEDVKEQQVVFAAADEEPARFTAFLQAFVSALDKAFAHASKDRLQVMMPHDFAHTDVLRLKTAHTKDDFERALLQRSRLGAWLPEELRRPVKPANPEAAAKKASLSSSRSSTPSSDGSL